MSIVPLVLRILFNSFIESIIDGTQCRANVDIILSTDLSLSGIAIASLFHYDCILHNRQIDGYEKEGNN